MRVVALGEERRVAGFALAAVQVITAEGPDDVVAAWRRLPEDTAVLLLTPMAHSALADHLGERPPLLAAVLPPEPLPPLGAGGPPGTGRGRA